MRGNQEEKLHWDFILFNVVTAVSCAYGRLSLRIQNYVQAV